MSAAPRFDYAGCRVLVTGGTSGIGYAIARAFFSAMPLSPSARSMS